MGSQDAPTVNEADREKSIVLYKRAQDIISRDLPMLPLWYPANMVIASKTVGNIKLDGSGDWNWEWGGRAAVEWTRRLAAGERFDPECEQLIEVAKLIDRIYEN